MSNSLFLSNPEPPLVVAHRGDMKNAPENTLAAFEQAVRKGADVVELDVHLTRDGALAVHHDYYLGRTIEGTGHIGEYDLAELQELDAGKWFGEQFSGERIPTLDEVLDLAKGRTRFEVEIRTPALQCLKQVVHQITYVGVENDVELTTLHVPLIPHMRQINPDLATGLFFQSLPEWQELPLGQQHALEWMTLADAQVAHLPLSLLSKDFIDRLHHLHIRTHSSDLNTSEAIRKAIELGVDQFSTNDLELALRFRKIV